VLLVFSGSVGAGAFVLVFGALVVSTVDNVIRAVLVGGRARVHSLLVFLGVLGGIFAFGAAGIFVGPALFVIALELLGMARVSLFPPAIQAPGPSLSA
jgi:predicted PurR-regulated permease PerM